jgi:LysM repeat protein
MPQNCPNGTLYTIRPGDSVYNLAGRFEITVESIIAANPNIDPANLQVGQQICIPVKDISGPCESGFFYTVVLGDTFFNIARRFNITTEALAAANPGVDPNKLQIGQEICVPAPTPPVRPCEGRFYTVKPGETFVSIAKKFGYTLDVLLVINSGIDPKQLRAGQEICLPPAPTPGAEPVPCPGGSIYIVELGDTFYTIAEKYSVPIEDLKKANPQIKDINKLDAGTPICIPS